MAACAFCAVVSGAEHDAVYRDEHVVAFLDHAPVFPGHTLIVPARHYDTLDDLPEDAETFTHRVGRTGRAGEAGVAVTFVGEWDLDEFERLRSKAGVPFRREVMELYGR